MDSARSNALRVLAIVLIIVGLVSVAGYGAGVLSTMGDADQSLVFWLLPFLLGGLAMAGVGTVMLVIWLLLVSSEPPRSEGSADRQNPINPRDD